LPERFGDESGFPGERSTDNHDRTPSTEGGQYGRQHVALHEDICGTRRSPDSKVCQGQFVNGLDQRPSSVGRNLKQRVPYLLVTPTDPVA
jgi:hypothetical protein